MRSRTTRWSTVVAAVLLLGSTGPGSASTAAVTIKAPAAVGLRQDFAVTGTARVAAKKPRAVNLYAKSGTVWKLVLKRRTTSTGSYRFLLTAGAKVGTARIQVRAPRAGSMPASRSREITVKFVSGSARPTTKPPAPKPVRGAYDAPARLPATEPLPLGSKSDWDWLLGSEGRWNPCAVITWAYNPDRTPYAALPDLKQAFAMISARSGLRFRYLGSTTAIRRGVLGTNPPGTDIVVNWADPRSAPSLGISDGIGGAGGTSSQEGPWMLNNGFIVLNRNSSLTGGHTLSGRPNWGQLMTHELMHAIGLDHAASRFQLMYPMASSANHRFGAGDLAGLAKAGSTGSCLTPWV